MLTTKLLERKPTTYANVFNRSTSGDTTPAQQDFVTNILTPLNSSNTAQMQGISILPDCYFTTANNQVLLYGRSLVGSTSAYYPDQVALIQNYVGNILSLAPSEIPIQLYSVDQANNGNTIDYTNANGKIMVAFNPDVFGDGTRAAYQVWSGNLVVNGRWSVMLI